MARRGLVRVLLQLVADTPVEFKVKVRYPIGRMEAGKEN